MVYIIHDQGTSEKQVKFDDITDVMNCEEVRFDLYGYTSHIYFVSACWAYRMPIDDEPCFT
jgi:hypothetical protein